MSYFQNGDPVHDMMGREITSGDTVIYAIGSDGQGTLRFYVVLAIKIDQPHYGRATQYWATLKVMPLLGSLRDYDGKLDTRPRYIQNPDQALIIKGDFLAEITRAFSVSMEAAS